MSIKIAIIGTGISAAYLAYRLSSGETTALELDGRVAERTSSKLNRYTISLFDKARGTGGRTASKRIDETSFDYGASFFKINNPFLKNILSSNNFQSCLELAKRKVSELDLDSLSFKESLEELYSSKPYGNSFTKKLLEKVNNIYLEKKIIQVKMNTDNKFKLLTSEGICIDEDFDIVVSSAPATQSAEIFSEFKDLSSKLEEINYLCNYMLLLSLGELPMFNEEHKSFWESDLIKVNNSIISEIRLNHRKEGRNTAKAAFIIEASPEFSSANLNTDKDFIENQILNEFKRVFTEDLKIDYRYLHRWLYSKPLIKTGSSQGSEHAFLKSSSGNIFAIGDYCTYLSYSSSKSEPVSLIESALLSAEELYQSLR